MKRVWQTIDGATFIDELDAAKHEEQLRDKIAMWDTAGHPTLDCSHAMYVRLRGEDAAEIFKHMNETHPDSIEVSDNEICNGDEGWWYWDEYYVPFDASLVLALRKIFENKNSTEIKSCFSF